MMNKELGDWQDWDDKDYTDFIEEYYGVKLALAQVIAKSYGDAAIAVVFERIATPSCYLQKDYEEWKVKNDKGTQVKATIQETTRMRVDGNVVWAPPETSKEKATQWRQSRNPTIEWCPEQEASADDVQKAMDKEVKEMWYTPPRGDYQHGSIFRKVKP